MQDIIPILAVFAALLVLVALSQPIAERLRVAPVVLLAAIGVAIGAVSTLLTHEQLSERAAEVARLFADLPIGSDVFIYVFLPLLIFEAAMTTDVRRVLDDAAPILLLAVIATLVAAAIVGLALWPISGQPLVVCLLLGAVVSTTDPAAVIAIFRDVGAPARLTRLVEGESLLNDASAIVAYTVLLGIIVTGAEPHLGDGAIAFFVSFIGGGVFGVVAGRLMLTLVGWTRDNPLAEATLTLALAYLAFIVGRPRVPRLGRGRDADGGHDGRARSGARASTRSTGRSSKACGGRWRSGRIRWCSCSPPSWCRNCWSTSASATLSCSSRSSSPPSSPAWRCCSSSCRS